MAAGWRVRILQFRERLREHGLLETCRFALYRCEEAVPVEKDLRTLRSVEAPPGPPLAIVEIGPESAGAIAAERRDPSRLLRAEGYFRRGYRSLVLTRGGEAIGDVWYVGRHTARTKDIHRHLRWFGLELGPDDVYMFDMHVAARERGGGLATHFMSRVLHHLRDAGVRRAFGYFDARNTPALWMHRVLGFRELPRVVIRKALVFERASPRVQGPGAPAAGAPRLEGAAGVPRERRP